MSGFYKSNEFKLGSYDSYATAGINISNIGAKMSYTSTKEKDFIPANLKLGAALNMDVDEYNSFGFILDFISLMISPVMVF